VNGSTVVCHEAYIQIPHLSLTRNHCSVYTARMTDNTADNHSNETPELDAWLEATNALGSGYRNARTFSSDQPIVHMTGPKGDILLRQWPASATAGHISWIADALDAAHQSIGDQIPTIAPLPDTPERRSLAIMGHQYTRSSYLPGFPLGRYGGYRTPAGQTINLPLHESAGAGDLVMEAARLIARVHLATGDIAERNDAPISNLNQMLRSVRDVWAEQRRLLGDIAADNRDIRRWLRCGNRIIPTASDLLRNEPTLMQERSVLVHGNFWPDDILVDRSAGNERITGIVGWQSAAAGSPVLDLAALAVHMQGWSAATTEAIVESYSRVAPLRPEQRRLVPVVASLDLVACVAWLLRLNYVDDNMIGHRAMPVIRSGMKTLLNSLEVLTHILAPDIEQTTRFQRRGGSAPGGTGRRFAPGVGRGRSTSPHRPDSKDRRKR